MTVISQDSESTRHEEEEQQNPGVSKGRRILQNISVEPLAFFVYFGNLTQAFIIQNLIIERVCLVNKEYSQSKCSQKVPPTDVQSEATDIIMYSSLLETFPGIILALCFGPWSDRKGRKMPILYNVLGNLISSVILIIIASQEQLQGEMILISSAIRGISGSTPIFTMAIYSYISDLASKQERTLRNGILEASTILGVALGMLLGGIVLDAGGYLAVFGMSTASIGLGFVYAIFRLKRKIAKKPADERESFLEHVKEMYLVMWRKPLQWKIKMMLYILAICGFVFSTNGLETVILVYTRTRFNWDAGIFTKFTTISLMIRIIGTIGVIAIFSRWLKFSESLIAAVGATVAMVGSIISSCMDKGWTLFLSGALMQSGNIATPVSRSAVSKMVHPTELGYIFSLVASLEACVPLIASPIFTSVYDGTKENFIGAIFLIGATVQLLTATIFVVIYFKRRKEPGTEQEELEDMDMEGAGESVA